MSKGEIAHDLFLSGLNCSQSVLLAFKERFGADEDELKRLAEGLGGGLARQRLTCGAVSSMAIVLSNEFSGKLLKAQLYAYIQRACEEFKSTAGSLLCGELLGETGKDTSPTPEKRTAEYYKKRPCAELVSLAAEITEKYLHLSPSETLETSEK
ncbi:MAG: C-GCAxxG-C-C family protein [Clostridia bacterium]|nr:C-GCAxxG-C-C family protein [Clostridia bacterium]